MAFCQTNVVGLFFSMPTWHAGKTPLQVATYWSVTYFLASCPHLQETCVAGLDGETAVEVDLRLLMMAVNKFRWQSSQPGQLHVDLHAALCHFKLA